MCRTKPLLRFTGLVFAILPIIVSCTDSPRYFNPDACENDYYGELLGSYQGRIKAELWTSEFHTELRNSCEWDVSLKLRSDAVGSGDAYCTIFAGVGFTLLDQQNVDQGNYTCVIAEDRRASMGFSDPYWEDFEFQKAPVWPINFRISSDGNHFHPLSSDQYEYITPLTGQHVTKETPARIDSVFTITKRDDGGIGFVNGRANYEDLDNFFPPDPNVSLTGVLIKQ